MLDRGHRADARRGDAPGQGIGLAVVAEIMELYGGDLQISSGAAENGTAVEVPIRESYHPAG